MADYLEREHYIPLRVSDLVDFLVDGKGTKDINPPLSGEEAEEFRRFALLAGQYYHLYFNAQMQRMKDAYAPYDPDSETISLGELKETERSESIQRLFQDTRSILDRANYIHLSRAEIEKIMEGASAWGLEMDVAWDVFERIDVFYRGDTVGRRTRRPWWRLWRKQELDVPEFNRLILILKLRPHKRLRANTDTKNIFIKFFKDLPKNDLEMVLPGTRVRLTRLDKGMIFYPLVMGVTVVIYAVLQSMFKFNNFLTGFFSSVALTWSLAIAFASYAYRSYHAYTVKKTAYSLQLTESLYFQSLDSNAGVFFRMFDEAEEQETREILLAYYYLWQQGGEAGLTAKELDDRIEQDFDAKLHIKFDFEILDALIKLEKHGIATQLDSRFKAIPIHEAITKMRDATTRISKEAATPRAPLGPRPISQAEKETQMLSKLQLEKHEAS